MTGVSGVLGGTVPTLAPLSTPPFNTNANPSTVSSAGFTDLTMDEQVAYIKAKGIGGVVTFNDNKSFGLSLDERTAFLAPTGFIPPNLNVSLAAFRDWPQEAQLVFVNNNGTGIPKTLIVPQTSTPQGAYYVETGLGSLAVLGVRPDDWMNNPSILTKDQFTAATWSEDDRIAYVLRAGTDVREGNLSSLPLLGKQVTLSGGAVYFLAQGRLTEVGSVFNTAPGSVTDTTAALNTFRSWPEATQLAYVDRYGTRTPSDGPKSVTFGTAPIAPATTPVPTTFYMRPDDSGGFDVGERPSNWYKTPTNLSIAEFVSLGGASPEWTERDRLDYANANKDSNNFFTLAPPPETPTAARANIMLSSDKQKIYFVDSLEKRAIANMPRADQVLLSNAINTPTYAAVKTRLASIGVSNDLAAANAAVTAGISNFTSKAPQTPTSSMIPGDALEGARRADYDKEWAYFNEQYTMLQTQVSGQLFFSEQDIADKLQAIQKRAERWVAYWPIHNPNTDVRDGNVNYRVHSAASENSALILARQSLADQESRIVQLTKQRENIAKSGIYNGKLLDVPTLVFMFQQSYNYQVEARVSANTTELNQVNDLLSTYSIMQNLVNKALERFTKDDDEKDTYGLSASRLDQLTDQERRAVIKFDANAQSPSDYNHPMERFHLNNRKETLSLITNQGVGTSTDTPFVGYTRTQWTQYSNRLANIVTELNQISQTLMNDINSLDKQKNRHFDLANGALSKMSEMIQSIGRNIA